MISCRQRHSIRVRIAVLTAIVSTVIMGSTFLIVDHRTAIDAREQLRTRALVDLDNALTVYDGTGKVRLGATVDPSVAPEPLRQADLVAATTYYDGRTMWAAVRLPDAQTTLTLAVPGDPIDQQRQSLRSAFFVAGLLGLALTAGLAAISVQSLTLRLRRAAVTATQIADGGVDRINDTGHDEIASLSQAVDRMADALTTRIEAEAAFSADVAHELRTPMTALVSAAELLPPGESSRRVGTQVTRLRKLVDDLLEISRLESGRDPRELWPCRLHDLAPDAEGDSDQLVLADPRRVDRILDNLLDNARKHTGSEARVIIEGTSITVIDQGPGFPDQLLRHGPRRFYRASPQPGSGLGLMICSRQAAAMGARLELTNRTHGGGCATLHFQAAHRSP